MTDFDFNKLQGTDLTEFTANSRNQIGDKIDRMNRESQKTIRVLQSINRAKDAEELRRHNELVEALKEAGEKVPLSLLVTTQMESKYNKILLEQRRQ